MGDKHVSPLQMADAELVKKMLREVLQANPAGVSLSRLTAQYKALTQEHIPHRLLGHDQLEGLLASMPSVVRTERPRGGEVLDGGVEQGWGRGSDPPWRGGGWRRGSDPPWRGGG